MPCQWRTEGENKNPRLGTDGDTVCRQFALSGKQTHFFITLRVFTFPSARVSRTR